MSEYSSAGEAPPECRTMVAGVDVAETAGEGWREAGRIEMAGMGGAAAEVATEAAAAMVTSGSNVDGPGATGDG